jgi:branched-chain amino acid transport system ATP-binding protein
MTILELDDVTKKYGELVAVDQVSFDVDRGELPALIGPNGAGKTTMYNLLTGKFPPTEGTITFDGEEVNDFSTAKRTRLGMGRSFQITNIFEGMTVRQNLRAPVIARSNARWNPLSRVGNQEAINAETEEYIDLVELSEIADQKTENLAYGDKRRVEIGVALATDPELMFLDEPTAGMNPTETQEMVDLIQSLDEETGTTFMVTEHDMDVVFSIASRVLVLDRGEIIADGSPEEIRTNERVQGAYLGEEVA